MASPGTSPTPQDILDKYRREFALRTAAGTIRPLVVPYHFYGFGLLVLYLSFSHTQRPWLYALRWPVLATVIAFQAKTLLQTSSTDMGSGFGAGIVAVYIMMSAATWLVWYRPQFESRRIVRREPAQKATQDGLESVTKGAESDKHAISDSTIRKRKISSRPEKEGMKDPGEEKEIEYYWQSYPDNFKARLDWVVDLLSNQRGERWNWAIPTLPPRPPSVRRSLGESVQGTDDEVRVSSAGHYTFSSRKEVFRACIPKVTLGYVLLDFLKTAMMHDPYFIIGPNSYPLPSHLASLHPVLVRMSRQLLTFVAITVALECGFLLQAILALLSEEGSRKHGIRSEAWMYPTQWGSFSIILTKGLNGLWGGWWHQTFRFLFAAPTNYLISKKIIEPRSITAKLVGLFVAFAISGMLHAGGSLTQFPDTYPMQPFVFFMLQAVGIIVQTTLCTSFKTPISSLPPSIKKLGNLIFTFGWLSLTADWLIDDFARGGLWLFEPLPFSFLRGMGLYPDRNGGWWCWQHMGMSWYSSPHHWWESGIALGGTSLAEMLGGFRGWVWKNGLW
ncbi:hypothetical protein PVAG01_10994 [Phlyctema vagabunda]|uniref:Wax synthase domain-containing protein n=1 Tax=Phlyctema vagabunda TaxID=108571 RepID=A0ABR4P3U4_9HELO